MRRNCTFWEGSKQNVVFELWEGRKEGRKLVASNVDATNEGEGKLGLYQSIILVMVCTYVYNKEKECRLDEIYKQAKQREEQIKHR